MGNQAMNMSGSGIRPRIQQYISWLRGNDMDQKVNANMQLVYLAKDPAISNLVRQMLNAAGFQISGSAVVPSAGGAAPYGGAGASGAPGQWGQALASMPQASPQIQGPPVPHSVGTQAAGNRAKGEGIVGPKIDPWVESRQIAESQGMYGGGGTSGGGGTTGSGNLGGTSGAGAIQSQHPEWADTFFGQAQPGALDALAGDPKQAWGMFVGQPNPNGGGNSLYNSTASNYAENDFKSSMALGGLFGGPGSGPGDTLKYADDFTKSAISGQGQYADPGKILTQALALAGSPENAGNEQNQRMIIETALNAVEPFMDPTQYGMLMNRVGRVMNDYMVSGVNNGIQDQSGVLLDQIYKAVGI